jgi:hypothetical protein
MSWDNPLGRDRLIIAKILKEILHQNIPKSPTEITRKGDFLFSHDKHYNSLDFFIMEKLCPA